MNAAVRALCVALVAWFVVLASLPAQVEDTSVHEPELESGIEAGRRDASPPVLTLPSWTAEDEREFRAGRPVNLGGGLWPEEDFPLQPVARRPRTTPALPNAVPAFETLAGHVVPSGPLNAALEAKYFAQRPEAWVLDPQRLLPAGRLRELERFLDQQAADGRFAVHLLVFSSAQELPAHISLDRFHEQWFAGTPDAVLAAFFLGDPRRARLVFPAGWRNAFTAGSMDSILDSAIGSALKSPYPTTQLDDFLLRVSVGLFDLEKRGPVANAGPVVASAGGSAAGASSRRVWGGIGATVGAMTLTGALWWWRRRSLVSPIHFPDREIMTRLGAPHSGGAGIVVSWHDIERPGLHRGR